MIGNKQKSFEYREENGNSNILLAIFQKKNETINESLTETEKFMKKYLFVVLD